MHHSLTTQSIVFRSEGKAANAKKHSIGVHFGQRIREGNMLSAYGQHRAVIPQNDGIKGGVPGAGGIPRYGGP